MQNQVVYVIKHIWLLVHLKIRMSVTMLSHTLKLVFLDLWFF